MSEKITFMCSKGEKPSKEKIGENGKCKRIGCPCRVKKGEATPKTPGAKKVEGGKKRKQ